MKSNLFFCALTIISLQACKNGADNNADQQKKPDTTEARQKTQGITISAVSDWKEIDSCMARRLFNNFDLHYRRRLETTQIQIPTNIFFEETLIRELAKRMTDSGYSGIRIYFGAYDSVIAAARIGTPFATSPTVFIVETKFLTKNGEKSHYDQFNKACPSTLNPFDAYNHGHLCPPDAKELCGGSYFH